MRLVIAGTRTALITHEEIRDWITISGWTVTEIVTGDARGVDWSAFTYALDNDIFFTLFNADWSLGHKAGPLRNERMAAYGDCLLAFWDGQSRGTKHMIATMKGYKPIIGVYI